MINRIDKIEEATKGSLTFLSNPSYIPHLYTTGATAILVKKGFVPERKPPCTLIRVDDPYDALAQLLELFASAGPVKTGISPTARIAPNASIGKDVFIGDYVCIGGGAVIGDQVSIHPHCFIGDHVVLGKHVKLHSGVRIYASCVLGNDIEIHSNAVIGADGFGFAPRQNSQYRKVAQIGNVVIGDHVEIGAGTTIDRATLGSTRIGQGVKLDNLIQVAHNVSIGENTVIAALVGISGSTKIGKNCMIGGQAGIGGHLTIGDNVKIAAQSGVTKDIGSDSTVMGFPAMEAKKFRRSLVYSRNLESTIKRLETLERKLRSMEGESPCGKLPPGSKEKK